MKVPFVDLSAQFEEISEEVRAGLDNLFATTSFVGGPTVAEFEREYASYLGVRACVGVANGTDALELAFRAVGVRAGGEVILPANSFIATAEAVSRIGATPVLVDADPTYLLIDPAQVEAALTPRTQAIAPVHLFGQAAPVEELCRIAERTGVPVVEDAAQAQGARRNGRAAGTLGTVAATSFYPGKNLGAAGDGGAVTTDDPDLARTVRLLGSHGSATKYHHEIIGMNSRLDTLQAAVLRAKLSRLEKWNELRRQAAARYHELLTAVPGVTLPTSAPGNEDVWHLYVIRVDRRDEILRALTHAGVGAGVHYPTPIHLTGAYRHLGHARGTFPVAEAAADRMISLPVFPHILPEQQEYVAQRLRDCLGA